MALDLKRNLGLVRDLDGGEWTSDPNVHRFGQMISIYICCPVCESIDETLDSKNVGRDGVVRYVWECGKCPAKDFIRLDTWGEAQYREKFDTTDVKR